MLEGESRREGDGGSQAAAHRVWSLLSLSGLVVMVSVSSCEGGLAGAAHEDRFALSVVAVGVVVVVGELGGRWWRRVNLRLAIRRSWAMRRSRFWRGVVVGGVVVGLGRGCDGGGVFVAGVVVEVVGGVVVTAWVVVVAEVVFDIVGGGCVVVVAVVVLEFVVGVVGGVVVVVGELGGRWWRRLNFRLAI